MTEQEKYMKEAIRQAQKARVLEEVPIGCVIVSLVQSRIDEVVIGSMNPKAGCAGSVLNLLEVEGFNHKVKITRGVLEEECSTMLSDFFKELREKKKRLKMLAKQQAQEAVDGDR